MQLKINLGAYGWRHEHWIGTFYPEDLPMADDGQSEDWRLAYYSNEFNCVLIPASYWCQSNGQGVQANDCAYWLDAVHESFQFFVECDRNMFDRISRNELTAALKVLSPQLLALVILDKNSPLPSMAAETKRVSKQGKKPDKNLFTELAAELEVELIDTAIDISEFSFIEDELSDLRVTRATVEQVVAQIENEASCGQGVNSDGGDSNHTIEATIIVSHPKMQAANLGKFRAVLDLMGF